MSQANAKQRAGRSGRVQAGTCYRLYPQALYDALDPYLAPEMQRMSLESVALTAKSIGGPPSHGTALCHFSFIADANGTPELSCVVPKAASGEGLQVSLA